MSREISIEAIALRAEMRVKHAEQDALILQDDLLVLRKLNAQLTAELEAVKTQLAQFEANNNGSPS
jgi:hypothetical protein